MSSIHLGIFAFCFLQLSPLIAIANNGLVFLYMAHADPNALFPTSSTLFESQIHQRLRNEKSYLKLSLLAVISICLLKHMRIAHSSYLRSKRSAFSPYFPLPLYASPCTFPVGPLPGLGRVVALGTVKLVCRSTPSAVRDSLVALHLRSVQYGLDTSGCQLFHTT